MTNTVLEALLNERQSIVDELAYESMSDDYRAILVQKLANIDARIDRILCF